MRAGPSIETLSTRIEVGVRIDSVLGNDLLAESIPVTRVILDGTRARKVPHQLQFLAPWAWLPTYDRAPLANYGQKVHLWSTLKSSELDVEIDLGWFQIESWKEAPGGVQVTALDLIRGIETNLLPGPSSPPRGATLQTELQRLAGTFPVILDNVPNSKVDSTIQWGQNRVDAIYDLCSAFNLHFEVRSDGYLHAWRETKSSPVATYAAKDLLLEVPRESGERKPNVWIAVGGGDTGAAGQRVVEVAKATWAPYTSEYGSVVEVVEVSSATSQAQVVEVANRELSSSLVVGSTRQLEIILDPRIELVDVIEVLPLEEPGFVVRVNAFSMPLTDPEASMRVDVGVLQW